MSAYSHRCSTHNFGICSTASTAARTSHGDEDAAAASEDEDDAAADAAVQEDVFAEVVLAKTPGESATRHSAMPRASC